MKLLIQRSPENGNKISECLSRHINCDWGDTCKSDKKLNDEAVANGNDRVVSYYDLDFGEIFIITEYDRTATTIMLAEEY